MRNNVLIAVIVVFILVVGAAMVGVVAYLFFPSSEESDSFFSSGNVALITIQGTILSADETLKSLDEVRRDHAIKAVVLRLESRGGSVAASQEILEGVNRLAEVKPVIASMGAVAASGAYYIACGATKIFANPGTITGSIGVRLDHVNVGDLLRFVKIQHETLKSGAQKNLAPLDQPISPEARVILERLLADMHEQFKETVARLRHIDRNDIDRIADGRIYSGREARELKLVDELGGLSLAIKAAGDLGGVEGEPKVFMPRRSKYRLMKRIIGEVTGAIEEALITLRFQQEQPLFFSWMP